jgi:hypothetical protein
MTSPTGAFMKWIRPFTVLLFVPLLLQSQTLRTDPQLEKLIREVRAEVNPNEALDFVLRVRENDRWFNFPKFQETAEYIQKTMSAIGLRKVELVPTPADGVTQYGFWTMPLAWDAKQASLEIVEPAVPGEMRVLADYRREPTSLVMWSGPTPPASRRHHRRGRRTEVLRTRGHRARRHKGQDRLFHRSQESQRARQCHHQAGRNQGRACQAGSSRDHQRFHRKSGIDQRPLLGQFLR